MEEVRLARQRQNRRETGVDLADAGLQLRHRILQCLLHIPAQRRVPEQQHHLQDDDSRDQQHINHAGATTGSDKTVSLLPLSS